MGTEPTDRASSPTQRAMYVKVIGKMTKHMAMEYTSTRMVPSTMASGRMTSNTVRVLRLGLTEASTGANIAMVPKTGSAIFLGRTVPIMTVNSAVMTSTEKEFTYGVMDVNTRANG